MLEAQKGCSKMGNYSEYGETIANESTIQLLKNVETMLHQFGKDASSESAEKFLKNYFQAKLDSRFEADRMMFLNLPDELQKRIDDESFQIVNIAFVDALMQGYLWGVRDVQELTSLIESESGTDEPEQVRNTDTPF